MIYFVFDVECVGLFGPTFAVGFTVFEGDKILEESLFLLDYWKESIWLDNATISDRVWLLTNIPEMPEAIKFPFVPNFQKAFKNAWERWEAKGAVMVADCPYPAETNFLEYLELKPYPLIDVASVRLAKGLDPIATESRLENELPKHNPLRDARQSARLFREALSRIY